MRMRLTLYCILAIVWLTANGNPLLARFNGVQVNVDPFGMNIIGDAANEPSIAVDPNNPNNIAIGWRQFDNIASNFRQAGVAYSTDAGQNWTAGVLDPGQFRSDPVLDFDADGNFYYASLTLINDEFQVDMFKSSDGGATWSNPVFAFGGDKQWIAIDRTSGIGRGHVYHHWNEQFSITPFTSFTRSVDGANSFENATSGPQPFMKWGTMDVGYDGTLYAVGAQQFEVQGHLFSKSINAQDATQSITFSQSQAINLGGTTTGFGSVNPSGLLGQVQVATDHSFTDTRGNIYVLGSVDPPGPDPLDVMMIRSSDGGATWSSPQRVNNDAGNGAYQWFGTMSVAPNGRIDAIWNDTRNALNAVSSELFYAYSFDGGQTWSGNTALSDPFNPTLGYPNQQKIGDYYDMISDNTGASLAWAATFTGGQDVYYLRIDAEILCDFDDDRLCAVTDINQMFSEGPIDAGVAVTPGVNDQFDLTDDGVIDLADRDEWLAVAASQNGLMSPYKLGDANLDGYVDGVDFVAWNENKFTPTLLWNEGNFNGDGVSDGLDFVDWNLNKFTSSDVIAVPEPAVSVALLALLTACALLHRPAPE